MSQDESYKLIFNSQDYQIPEQFEKLIKISKTIFRELFSKREYTIRSNVSDETIPLFIQYLINGNSSGIHIYNILEFSRLAKEFELTELEELINNKKEKWTKLETLIENESNSMQLENNGQHNDKDQIIKELSYKVEFLLDTTINKEDLENQKVEYETMVKEKISRTLNEHQLIIDSKFNELIEKIESQNQNLLEKMKSIENNVEKMKNEIEQRQNEDKSHIDNELAKFTNQIDISQKDINNLKEEINQKSTEIELSTKEAFLSVNQKIDEIKATYVTKTIYNLIIY